MQVVNLGSDPKCTVGECGVKQGKNMVNKGCVIDQISSLNNGASNLSRNLGYHVKTLTQSDSTQKVWEL